MPFGLSGAAPNFQRAIDIILQPVIGSFVSVYMDDVIITSPSFKDHLDHLTQFNLFTDASGVGISAVLQQNQKPIAFASRTLNKAERNYTVTERECLAVIWALNKFKTYFGPLPVKVITDHAALTKLTNGELRVYIPGSLRKDIMKEFHDLPLAGHLGKRKTYLKLRDTCYFPFMRKYIFEYVSTCDRCQKFNYKNALPAGRLMPIVSKYPNEIVTLDLVGPYPASRPERYKFILVITDHFTKWSRYGAPISLISDNGPQFISDVFEHLSHRLDIKHMKTVTYRPQSNLTERVNRNLVQMIASFVEENHENWDQFLHEFAFALRTAVRVYRPRQSDTISSDSPIETLYDEQEVSHGSNRSKQGQFKEHRKTSSQERKDPDKDLIIRTGKRHAPEQRQGIKRSIPSSISSKTHKFNKPNTSSPGVQSIAGPSKLPERRTATTTSGSRMEVSGRDNQTRQTRATTRRHNEQAEKTIRSNQTNTRRPCQYNLRNRIQEKTESMRTSTTSKSTAYLAAYSAEEASVWKR
ncbi:retrovirus-related Pol polyprotein from transposon 17.6 [Trichonephila clavipes]|nr:retrovirus-related Pol polyprotein from transposon 17.6 [Trichonephila clavipes]